MPSAPVGVAVLSARQNYFRLIAGLLLGVAFTACVPIAPARQREQQVAYQFEQIGPKQQAIEALNSTPTQFVMDFPEDPNSWERAFIFFNKYTARQSIFESDKPVWNSKISNFNAPSDSFHYEVTRRLEKNGFKYSISCIPNPQLIDSKVASNDQAALNARNLARFIREGTLEVSLLAR